MRQRGVRHEYIQWRSSIQSSQLPPLDHTQNYGIKIAQRPHKQGAAITNLTAKAGSLAGLISEICKFNAKADATASTSTATHQMISGTYDLSSTATTIVEAGIEKLQTNQPPQHS